MTGEYAAVGLFCDDSSAKVILSVVDGRPRSIQVQLSVARVDVESNVA